MVYIQLSDEEKIQVLLLALGLFLSALTLSICLAASFCPLNKWLINRSAKKRLRKIQQQQQQHYLNQNQHHHHHSYRSPSLRHNYAANYQAGNFFVGQARQLQYNQRVPFSKGSSLASSYIGPPPAYEAALRATRLRSLTGSLYSQDSGSDSTVSKPPPDWNNALECAAQVQQQPLDFGDYFHQPKGHENNQQYGQADKTELSSVAGVKRKQQPPVMLRLWVKVLEPSELVVRARGISTGNNNDEGVELLGASKEVEVSEAPICTGNPVKAHRQMSIPQLFGSLVSNLSVSNSVSNQNKPLEDVKIHIATSDNQIRTQQEAGKESNEEIQTTKQKMSSHNIVNEPPARSEINNDKENSDKDFVVSVPPTSGEDSSPPPTRKFAKLTDDNNNPYQSAPPKLLETINSITSRVLHMNVASFSYVKDETLISTKKHNQLNFYQLYLKNKQEQQEAATNNLSKSCQLVISICDIENVLNSSWLNEKSCALLSNNSAIYVQCEILLPKSKSARLLGPLSKALPGSGSNDDAANKRHTVNFESVISASAVESRPTHSTLTSSIPSKAADSIQSCGNQEVSGSEAAEDCSSTTNETKSTNDELADQQQACVSNSTTPNSTNWRHEPSADGRSIVVFSSVPKEIAHQQQLTASVVNSQAHQQQHNLSDLIQFDSVFVSPILNRSTIESGYIRFRIYSQCKYVNETCLAELKLPLKQLLQSQTNDNLNDVLNNNPVLGLQAHRQSDFILNNLLANLVTASTGSPLNTLIEQISSEEREEEDANYNHNKNQDEKFQRAVVVKQNSNPQFLKSMLPGWLSTNQSKLSSKVAETNKGLKGSSSFNDSLYRLTDNIESQQQQQQDNNNNNNNNTHRQRSLVEETERRIEENYYRSLMVSHWLNYLVAPSYECQLVDEAKGKIILGLSYLPTSNRVIFNAHRATIDDESYANGKQMMKNLRLQTGTCYLLRLLMVVNGRVVKRKQTPVSRKPEWDSQEPITFDLVSISVEQPSFIVALVMRNASGAMSTGSLQNLRATTISQQQVCNCGLSNHHHHHQQHHHSIQSSRQSKPSRPCDVQSEPESLQHFGATYRSSAIVDNHLSSHQNNNNNNNNSNSNNNNGCKSNGRQHFERDLVIGHLVLNDEIWREMRAQPRKQIVKQFKMY